MTTEDFDRALDDMRRQIDEALKPFVALADSIDRMLAPARQFIAATDKAVAKAAKPVDLPWRLPARSLIGPMVYRPKPEGLIFIDVAKGDYTPDELEQLGATLIAAAWMCRREQAEIADEETR